MLTLDHVERLGGSQLNRSFDGLDELSAQSELAEESDVDSADPAYYAPAAKQLPEPLQKTLQLESTSKKQDQLFFEFFGMYTKESVSAQKRTSTRAKVDFNARKIAFASSDSQRA